MFEKIITTPMRTKTQHLNFFVCGKRLIRHTSLIFYQLFIYIFSDYCFVVSLDDV